MAMFMKRRTAVRILSFSIAAVAVLSILAFRYKIEAMTSQSKLEQTLVQNVSNLTTYASDIRSDLQKIQYANTAPMLASLSSKLWREASFAKESLDLLPVSYSRLQNTDKLLSQVGDYCVSLSKKFSAGEPITDEERQKLAVLSEYCEKMLNEIAVVSDELSTGTLTYAMMNDELHRSMDGKEAAVSVTEGFSEFEEGFSAYPSLIYDGPFSDHILQQSPRSLAGTYTVTEDAARQAAAKALGVQTSQLTLEETEYSRMESFCFSGDGVYAIVTKQGGFVCTVLKERMPQSENISADDALKRAQSYLSSLGYENLDSSYYEIAGNILTANFAARQGNVTMYPDLVKVGVAMDSGEIVALDARGYLMNHTSRTGLTPALTSAQAQKSVSPLLNVKQSKLCIVPSDGLNETLCWEFSCETADGSQVLVYINAKTGMEEQILLLLIGDYGQLTI